MVALRNGVSVNLPALPTGFYDQPSLSGRWKGTTLRMRLESKFVPEPMSGCWLWIGCINQGGYAQISVYGLGARSAHRLMYEMHKGAVPDGMDVCHKCDVRSYVNPDHLFAGFATENIHDMQRKGRSRGAVGTKNIKAKITEEEVRLIRLEDGTLSQIGAKYGLKTSAVWSIRNKQTWGHVV